MLDAERTLASSEALLAQAQAEFSDSTLSLFLALGGGWQTATVVGWMISHSPAALVSLALWNTSCLASSDGIEDALPCDT